ncbi:YadA-like family protein [Mesorhizobium sp. RP14(2022)]|uniref:YadA-like family protein n=1 Tax=Mesorhizobium liriopis TaxID=2953882 RepID=A0ABT1C8M1_9HYPH|nr:YadA-like family protein [Mesorhizobium liriopis]MCO6051184.1 YadA-like family protein [Mesorhizobium liriopis]
MQLTKRKLLWAASVAAIGWASSAEAQTALVSACSGVSLSRSVVTDILRPVVTDVIAPTQSAVNGLLGSTVLGTLLGTLPQPVSVDAAGVLSNAASGQPISLSALTTSGAVIAPSDECITTADGVQLDTEAGIAIGGNRISGLGTNGATASAADLDAVALGNGASTATGATGALALGTGAEVGLNAAGAVAIGRGANATAANSVALGAGSATNASLAAAAYNPGTTPLAGGTAVGEVSIGATGAERRLTNVAAGSADTDAANITQLRAVADGGIRYDDATRTIATLTGTGGTRLTNLRPAILNETSSDAVTGAQLHETNQALAALNNVSVRYDTDTAGNKTNSITLQGGNTDAPVRVRNVAAAEEATDAVNLQQLREAVAAGPVDNAEDVYRRSRAYTDARVDEVRDEAHQAAAIGLAAASLRFDDAPGKVSMGIGAGVWRGEGAFAAGLGYTNESGRMRLNATASTAGGKVGGGAGMSFTFN